MPDSVHVPVLGNVNKGTAIAGILAVAGVGAYLVFKKKKAASAQATAQGAYAYGYGGQAEYAYGYGSGQNPYGLYGYGYGPYGLGAYGPGTVPEGYGYGYYGAGSSQEPVQQQATTNAEWSQAAVSALTAQGYDGQTVLSALGQYLLGHQLNTDQQSTVAAAIAAEGYPPVPGPNGMPPAMNTGGGPHPPPPPPPNSHKVPTPNVVGMPAGEAHNVIVAARLHPFQTNWGVGNASWIVNHQTPKAGTEQKIGSMVWFSTKSPAKK